MINDQHAFIRSMFHIFQLTLVLNIYIYPPFLWKKLLINLLKISLIFVSASVANDEVPKATFKFNA